MWSFDMYHTSEHYRAIVDNGAVVLARSMDELLAHTSDALNVPESRAKAMRQTLEQKAAYCDGTSARRFVEALSSAIVSKGLSVAVTDRREFSNTTEAVAPFRQKEAPVSLVREAL
jgi:hypothetical protein